MPHNALDLKNKPIKAVLFDFGQTLVDSADGFRMAEKIAKDRIFTDLLSTVRSIPKDIFLKEYRRIRKEHHQRASISRYLIWQAVYHYFNQNPDPKCLEEWEQEYWEQVNAQTLPFPETLSVLKTLSARYQLALITNAQDQRSAGRHRLALFPKIEQYFQVVIVAGEKGVPPKPDPVPFRSCLQRLNIAPDQAVFVGDDWQMDICGAREVGIYPVWLKHRLVPRSWPEVNASVPVISGLDQLPGLIGPI